MMMHNIKRYYLTRRNLRAFYTATTPPSSPKKKKIPTSYNNWFQNKPLPHTLYF